MALTLDHFAQLRPRLYHLTSRGNCDRILQSRRIDCASSLLRLGKRPDLMSMPRRAIEEVRIDGTCVTIRDQAVLHEGNIAFEPGWSFQDVVQALNDHVFYWPGNERGPIRPGLNHFKRYNTPDNVVMSLATGDVLRANADRSPKFCRFNSGSPRCVSGRKSPRGPSTFVEADRFSGTASAVVEFVYHQTSSIRACDVVVLEVSDVIEGRPA